MRKIILRRIFKEIFSSYATSEIIEEVYDKTYDFASLHFFVNTIFELQFATMDIRTSLSSLKCFDART